MYEDLSPWVVVLNPGTDEETEYSSHVHFRAALASAREVGGEVMKRTPEGHLTTEF